MKTLTKAAAEAGPEGQLALGRLQERIGDLDAAAAAYDQAKARRRARTPSPRSRPSPCGRGTAKDALAIAKQAVEAGATPGGPRREARALVRSEDGPAALVAADKAVAAGASSAMAHVARGEALIALGKNADAEAALRKAVEIDPKSALAWSRLARAQLAARQAGGRRRLGPEGHRARRQVRRGLRDPRGGDRGREPEELERRHRPGPAGRVPRPQEPERAGRGRQDLRGERPARAGRGRLPPGAPVRPRVRAGPPRPHPGRAQPRQPRRRARRGEEGRGRDADEPRHRAAHRRDDGPQGRLRGGRSPSWRRRRRGCPATPTAGPSSAARTTPCAATTRRRRPSRRPSSSPRRTQLPDAPTASSSARPATSRRPSPSCRRSPARPATRTRRAGPTSAGSTAT